MKCAVALLLGFLLAGPALAQPASTSPPSGTLQAPPHRPAPAAPAAPPTPPKAAPRTPVIREAPLVSPRPGSPAQKPPQAAPQRPAAHATHGTPAKPGAKPPPRPAIRPVPAPVPVPVPTPAPTEPAKPAEPAKGSNSGLPLPRFASLRSDEIYFRSGPGTRYPIDWVYKRRELPVEIEREFETWRLVRDPDGTKGWVHQATLAGRRTGIVIGAEHTMHRDASDDASVVARLKPGVIVRVRSCEAGAAWCQVQVNDIRGWLKRAEMWGVYPGEAVQ